MWSLKFPVNDLFLLSSSLPPFELFNPNYYVFINVCWVYLKSFKQMLLMNSIWSSILTNPREQLVDLIRLVLKAPVVLFVLIYDFVLRIKFLTINIVLCIDIYLMN